MQTSDPQNGKQPENQNSLKSSLKNSLNSKPSSSLKTKNSLNKPRRPPAFSLPAASVSYRFTAACWPPPC